MLAQALDRLHHQFPQGPPAEEDVWRQDVAFYPRHWTSRDRWPASLDRPALLVEPGKVPATRRELHSRAVQVTTVDEALDLYIRVSGWGTGTGARAIARVAKPLHDPTAPVKLLTSLLGARTGDPTTVYARLHHGGDLKMSGLGPAFFTKWLYFAGYEPALRADRTPPLILDRYVARVFGWPEGNWLAQDYATYLDLAAEIRTAWCPTSGLHVVEYGLFRTGKALG